MKQRTRCPMNLYLIRLVAIIALGAYVSPAPGQEDSPDPAGRIFVSEICERFDVPVQTANRTGSGTMTQSWHLFQSVPAAASL